eukprot:scaffold74976_cov14-Tisochrysis_lutea.AAC.1
MSDAWEGRQGPGWGSSHTGHTLLQPDLRLVPLLRHRCSNILLYRLWGSNGRDGAERLTSVLPGTEEP